MKKLLFAGTVLLCCAAVNAQIINTNFNAANDTTVWYRTGNEAYNSAVVGTNVEMDVYCFTGLIGAYAYIQFDLSALGTNVVVLDAELSLAQAASNPEQSFAGGHSIRNDSITTDRFACYGLNNVAGNTPQDWSQTNLSFNTSGNEITAASANGTDPFNTISGLATDLSSDESISAPNVTVTGDNVDTFVQARMIDNGFITFMVDLGNNDNGKGFAFDAIESSNNVPMLSLSYTNGVPPEPPEPKSAVTFESVADGWTDNAFATMEPLYVNASSWYEMKADDTLGVGTTFDVWTNNMTINTIRFWQTRYYATNSITIEIYSNVNQNASEMINEMTPGNLMKTIVVEPTTTHGNNNGLDIMEITLVTNDQFVVSEIPDGVDPMGYYMYIYPTIPADITDVQAENNLFLWNYATYDVNPVSAYATPLSNSNTNRELGMALVSTEGFVQAPLPRPVVPGQADLIADADTSIHFGTQEGNNYGSSATIDTRQNDTAPRDFMAYIRFDLTGIYGPITNASLSLLQLDNGTGLNNDRVRIWGLNNVSNNTSQTWGENSLTWNAAGGEINTNIYPNPSAGESPVYTDRVTDFNHTVLGISEMVGGGVTLSGQPVIDWLESMRTSTGYATFIVDFPAFGASNDRTIVYYARESGDALAPTLTLQYDDQSGTDYVGFMAKYPTSGALTNKTDDPDNDGIINIGEFGFGGNPMDADDVGLPISGMSDGMWFYFVSPQLTNALGEQIIYTLVESPSLTPATWNYIFPDAVGTGIWVGAESYYSITNRIEIDPANANSYYRSTLDFF